MTYPIETMSKFWLNWLQTSQGQMQQNVQQWQQGAAKSWPSPFSFWQSAGTNPFGATQWLTQATTMQQEFFSQWMKNLSAIQTQSMGAFNPWQNIASAFKPQPFTFPQFPFAPGASSSGAVKEPVAEAPAPKAETRPEVKETKEAKPAPKPKARAKVEEQATDIELSLAKPEPKVEAKAEVEPETPAPVAEIKAEPKVEAPKPVLAVVEETRVVPVAAAPAPKPVLAGKPVLTPVQPVLTEEEEEEDISLPDMPLLNGTTGLEASPSPAAIISPTANSVMRAHNGLTIAAAAAARRSVVARRSSRRRPH